MKDESDPGASSDIEPITERRHGGRVTINKQFDSFDQFVREYVANLSGTGAFVRSDTPLPVGTEIALKFSIVLDGVETVEGVGVVVRVESDPPGMGVVFKELGAYSKKLIERMLLAGG